MPLAEAGSRDQGGGPAGTEQARLGSAEAEVAAAKGAGGGGAEAVTVGNGFSRASLSFRGKEFRGPGGTRGFGKGRQWGWRRRRGWQRLPLVSPPPTVPPTSHLSPPPTFVPSLAPVSHVGEDGDRGLFSPQDRQAIASYMAIPPMLKARAPKGGKRGCCYRGQHRQRLAGGVCEADGRQRLGGSGYGERGGVQGHAALRATLPLPGRKLWVTRLGHSPTRWAQLLLRQGVRTSSRATQNEDPPSKPPGPPALENLQP